MASLGKVDSATSLVERMQTRLAGLTHVGTLAFGKVHSAVFDLMCGDHARATPKAFELVSLAREHELTIHGAFGAFLHGWTTTKSGSLDAGLENMRRGVALLREQNILLFDGLLKIALAEALKLRRAIYAPRSGGFRRRAGNGRTHGLPRI